MPSALGVVVGGLLRCYEGYFLEWEWKINGMGEFGRRDWEVKSVEGGDLEEVVRSG